MMEGNQSQQQNYARPSSYNMNHSRPGDFLIFVQITDRDYTEQEVWALKRIASHLGFVVHEYQDLTDEEIQIKIREWRDKDHKDDNCVVVAILTHGYEDYLWAKDTQYHYGNIWEAFSNHKDMEGKPKIFIIQACRGGMIDQGKVVNPTNGQESSTRKKLGKIQKYVYKNIYPKEADYLVIFSTPMHYVSVRGWLCEALLKVLGGKDYTDMDLMSQLTVAANLLSHRETNVALDKQTEESTPIKQCIEIFSTLISELYLPSQGKIIK